MFRRMSAEVPQKSTGSPTGPLLCFCAAFELGLKCTLGATLVLNVVNIALKRTSAMEVAKVVFLQSLRFRNKFRTILLRSTWNVQMFAKLKLVSTRARLDAFQDCKVYWRLRSVWIRCASQGRPGL